MAPRRLRPHVAICCKTFPLCSNGLQAVTGIACDNDATRKCLGCRCLTTAILPAGRLHGGFSWIEGYDFTPDAAPSAAVVLTRSVAAAFDHNAEEVAAAF
jgi:hypothetical protein